MVINIRAESYESAAVQTLVQEMAEDLARYYGPGRYPPQDPAHWSPPHGTMLVVRLDNVPAACGGLIRHDQVTAELKRVFTRPRFRRRGVARQLVAALEDAAVRLGYRRVVLETGVPQRHAQALYQRAGYSAIPCWPPHDEDPTSVCYGKDLGGVSGSVDGARPS